MLAAAIWDRAFPPKLETPEQAQARQAQLSAAQTVARDEAIRAAKDAKLCHIKDVCGKYKQARQDCATAGNFRLCIEIKLGRQSFSPIEQCTDDGNMIYYPPDMPNFTTCFFAGFSYFK